jgi:hypothetical protein
VLPVGQTCIQYTPASDSIRQSCPTGDMPFAARIKVVRNYPFASSCRLSVEVQVLLQSPIKEMYLVRELQGREVGSDEPRRRRLSACIV